MLVITVRNLEEAQRKLDVAMRHILNWLREHSLQLTTQKSEIVLLTRKRIDTIAPVRIVDVTIETKKAVKYLGLWLDNKLSFYEHIRQTSEKASKVAATLSWLMANVGGPKPSRRRLLMSVVHSILLYGAEVWAEALDVEFHRKKPGAVQRRCALRIACSYRMVSKETVLVIAGVMPIRLMAKQRKLVYDNKDRMGKVNAAKEARDIVLDAWQHDWDCTERGRWTRRLIGQIRPWTERKHGEVNYYITQFLTGHGFFLAYLYKIGKVSSPACVYCETALDNAEHTLFACSRWTNKRTELERMTL